MQGLEKIFNKIISNKNLHSRFLNTLSVMELLGAQKLSRLVPYMENNTPFLEHVAEEYRHAYFLRTLAQKVSQEPINDYETSRLLAKHRSFLYINHMHKRLCLLLKQRALSDRSMLKRRAYLLSTFAIETRALPFYEAYQEALSEAGIAISVRSVIAEEASHLATINKLIATDPPLKALIEPSLAIENSLFTKWLESILMHIASL